MELRAPSLVVISIPILGGHSEDYKSSSSVGRNQN
jgi:hypothetical protein